MSMENRRRLAALFPSQAQRIMEERGVLHRIYIRRLLALEKYGGRCVVCGEDKPGLLEMRRLDMPPAKKAYDNTVKWLEANGYPEGAVEIRCDDHNQKPMFGYPRD